MTSHSSTTSSPYDSKNITNTVTQKKRRLFMYVKNQDQDQWVKAFQAKNPEMEIFCHPHWPSKDNSCLDQLSQDFEDQDDQCETYDYAFVWRPPAGLLSCYPKLKAIFSLGAGIEHMASDPFLPDIPVVRMADQGLKDMMAEYITMCTLMAHRQMPRMIAQQQKKDFTRIHAVEAKNFTVGLMGYGELAQAVGDMLRPFGYIIKAWSRSPKNTPDGIYHFHGISQLDDFISDCDVIASILPDTAETRGLVNAKFLAKMKRGSSLINTGRGTLINEGDLIDALDTEQLENAYLDVFPNEPLTQSSPLWDHPKIFISPHSSSITRPTSAAKYVTAEMDIIEKGQKPKALMDRNRGY